MGLEDDNDTLAKLRRFTLLVALVLFIYAVSGAELDLNGEFRPLGIPLKVTRANLLGHGLVITSTYASVRYCLFALILADSPIKARRRLRHGSQAMWRPASARGAAGFRSEFEADLHKYYPRYARWTVGPVEVRDVQEGFAAVPPVIPLPLRVIGQIHNFDYWLPVLANLLALITYASRQFFLR